MIHTFVYIACSLDGYIARENDDLTWLVNLPHDPQDDFGYAKFMQKIDALLMGRRTFETVLGFGEWTYTKPVYVLGSQPIPLAMQQKAQLINGTPHEILAQLEQQGVQNLYIDGGKTIQSFLQCNLVDEIILTQVAKILGSGIPLFSKMATEIDFSIMSTTKLTDDLVQIHLIKK